MRSRQSLFRREKAYGRIQNISATITKSFGAMKETSPATEKPLGATTKSFGATHKSFELPRKTSERPSKTPELTRYRFRIVHKASGAAGKPTAQRGKRSGARHQTSIPAVKLRNAESNARGGTEKRGKRRRSFASAGIRLISCADRGGAEPVCPGAHRQRLRFSRDHRRNGTDEIVRRGRSIRTARAGARPPSSRTRAASYSPG